MALDDALHRKRLKRCEDDIEPFPFSVQKDGASAVAHLLSFDLRYGILVVSPYAALG